MTGPPRRTLTDPREMRALAHPVRVALLETLGREGPLTATEAGELIGQSPANTSFHLRTLAKYGFVEEAPGASGRRRPWRRVGPPGHAFIVDDGDASASTAALELARRVRARAEQRRDEWEATRSAYPPEWSDAWFAFDGLTYLTADELAAVGAEMLTIIERYGDRAADRTRRPAGAYPVAIVAHGHPLPPGPSGN